MLMSVITVLSEPSPSGAFGGGISSNNRFVNVTLCPANHLPLDLQAQPVHDLPDLVDVGDHLMMADEVPVDDHDGARSRRNAWTGRIAPFFQKEL